MDYGEYSLQRCEKQTKQNGGSSRQTGFRSNLSLLLSVSYFLFFCFIGFPEWSFGRNVMSAEKGV